MATLLLIDAVLGSEAAQPGRNRQGAFRSALELEICIGCYRHSCLKVQSELTSPLPIISELEIGVGHLGSLYRLIRIEGPSKSDYGPVQIGRGLKPAAQSRQQSRPNAKEISP